MAAAERDSWRTMDDGGSAPVDIVSWETTRGVFAVDDVNRRSPDLPFSPPDTTTTRGCPAATGRRMADKGGVGTATRDTGTSGQNSTTCSAMDIASARPISPPHRRSIQVWIGKLLALC